MNSLQERLQAELSSLAAVSGPDLRCSEDALALLRTFLDALERGEVRAAQPDGRGGWSVNAWVKQGILTVFRAGANCDMTAGGLSFIDKDLIPARTLSVADGIRIVPGGSSIRRGAYVAGGVICMPPMYINIGAYVDEGTMVDSHALVGTCAQIGKRVHISAAAQIGGVLEPAGARPVVVEDDVLIGGNCGVYEGVRLSHRAVLGSGVVLNASTPVYDIVNGTVLRSTADEPLVIPPNAVVVQGSRAIRGAFAESHGLNIATPIIVKYRDERTDSRTALEEALR